MTSAVGFLTLCLVDFSWPRSLHFCSFLSELPTPSPHPFSARLPNTRFLFLSPQSHPRRSLAVRLLALSFGIPGDAYTSLSITPLYLPLLATFFNLVVLLSFYRFMDPVALTPGLALFELPDVAAACAPSQLPVSPDPVPFPSDVVRRLTLTGDPPLSSVCARTCSPTVPTGSSAKFTSRSRGLVRLLCLPLSSSSRNVYSRSNLASAT